MVIRQQKHATCFATLLQNVLKSYVMRFTTHIQTCLATSKGCCKLCEYWLLMDKITKESCHVKELHHLLQNKFALGQGKTCNIYRFCCKKWNYSLLSAKTFSNLQQPDLLPGRLNVSSKTCNIAF